MKEDLIKHIFNVFDPQEVLPPDDPRYVECSIERGSVGLLSTLAHTIRRADGCTYQLLSGHRGCGKTTELRRLQHELLKKKPLHFVVYCEADKYTAMNDVEYTDVILAVMQQIWLDAKSMGISLESGRLKSFIEDLKGILTAPIEPKDVEIDAGITKLTFDIKKNPNNRELVRQYLRPRATTFLEAVNEIIEEAKQAFQDMGYGGLVVIVDNLDRIFRNPIPNTNFTSHDALFINAGDYLRSLSCNVIYTLPPALLYSPNGAKLAAIYGTRPQMLPMIPVSTRNGEENERGTAKLVEAIDRRLAYIDKSLSDKAFDSRETIKRLCAASGGYVRSLIALARAATNYVDDLPITTKAVEQNIRDARDGFVRAIRNQEQWQLLREVSNTKRISDSEDCLQLLDTFTVFEYRDAEGPWYDVNPIVREASEFRK